MPARRIRHTRAASKSKEAGGNEGGDNDGDVRGHINLETASLAGTVELPRAGFLPPAGTLITIVPEWGRSSQAGLTEIARRLIFPHRDDIRKVRGDRATPRG